MLYLSIFIESGAMHRVFIYFSTTQWWAMSLYWLAQFIVLIKPALVVGVFFVVPTWAAIEAPYDLYESKAEITVESLLPLAKTGDVTAQFNLAELFREGTTVKRNYGEAIKWFTRAAEQGDADAQHNLGTMYLHGFGTSPDYDEALKWIRKAVEQGLVEAQYNLALMYHEGKGVPQDDGMMVKWLTRTAEQGLPDAQYHLGLVYRQGVGVKTDIVHAYAWFGIAAVGGYMKAQSARDNVAKKLNSDELEEAQKLAIKLWRLYGKK
jgi:uncharacterized protein